MNYIFDFFGVICSELSPVWLAKHLPDHDIASLRRDYINDADLGKLALADYYNKLAELSDQEPEDVRQQIQSLIKIDPKMVALLKELGVSGRIALCSNAPSELIRPILVEHNLEELFDVIVISGELGMMKPHAKIFLHTLDLIGSVPDQTVFIDDSEKNVLAAKELGMGTILFTGHDSVRSLAPHCFS